MAGGLALLAAVGWQMLLAGLPDPQSLPERLDTPSVRITDRKWRLLYEALPEDGGRHAVIPLGQMPLACQQATIATEDRHFYTNPGIDPAGILRAAWINLKGGETIAGGSTITQQVARNLLLEAGERGERSLRRKLREAFLAWRLTRRFSKDQILAFYLNQTYYGGMAYGLEAAAQTFFGKPAARLDLAECAVLAGLPQAPSHYNPFTDLEAAQARQKVVLGLMQDAGLIDAQQRSLAEREPLVLAETPYPIEAPHFVMMVRSELDRLFTPEQIYAQGGLVVRTTLDLDWQRLAEGAVKRHLENLQHSSDGRGHNVNSAALVALDPHSGEVLTLVGSPDYFDTEHHGAINMVLSPRQPGSALKPLVYAAALDPQQSAQRGQAPWTAATMLLDVRTAFQTAEGEAYVPSNYDLHEHGPVLVRQALASSLNIPAVLTMDHVGLPNLIQFAAKLGIHTLRDPKTYDLSLALGGGEVRLLDLTAAYGSFANTGYQVTPRLILDVRTLEDQVVYTPAPMPQTRVLDERVAWLISDILSDNDARRIGFGANSILRLERPAAVKTGTTSNFHDNWTIGYTPDLVVGVWSGNTDYTPMREVNGLSGAAPIWHQFLRSVLVGRPPAEFQRPKGLVQVEVCSLSGQLPGQACPYRRPEWFIAGTEPHEHDRLFRQVSVDQVTGRLATGDTPPERRKPVLALDLPPQAAAWGRSQGWVLLGDLVGGGQPGANSLARGVTNPNQYNPQEALAAQPVVPGDAGTDTGQPVASMHDGAALQLVTPASGSTFRFSKYMNADVQRILVEAVGPAQMQQVTLWVDGEAVEHWQAAPFQAWWALVPGLHQAWVSATLAGGQTITSPRITFTVLDE